MSDETMAIHGVSDKGHHIVGIGNLRVHIVRDGDYWCAQGLEIDYVAQGKTIRDVQKAFEQGLAATIHENIEMHGTIEPVLKVAPQEIWEEVLTHPYRFDLVSVHEARPIESEGFPFKGIDYLMPKAA